MSTPVFCSMLFNLLRLLIWVLVFCWSYSAYSSLCATKDFDNQLLNDLRYLSSEKLEGRKTRSQGSLLAQQYLQERYSSVGLDHFGEVNGYLHPFRYKNGFTQSTGVNVIGKFEPSPETKNKSPIVITAHYDHLGKIKHKYYLGADDNASGVAVMLYLAQNVISEKIKAKNAQSQNQCYRFTHPIIFVATDAEEIGLHGAKAFLREQTNADTPIRANLNLDMLAQVGRPPRLYLSGVNSLASFEGLVSMINSTSLMNKDLKLIRNHRQSRRRSAASHRINYRTASDHAIFADQDIPYLFLGVVDHPLYHTPKDTYDNVDHERFIQVARIAWILLIEMDKRLGNH